MVQMNFAQNELQCKLVYYGPALSGKTTNLEIIFDKAPKEKRGELVSVTTEGDRTLFFDYMPLDIGNVKGVDSKFKFQLYTVPGQVYYNTTRKVVLRGADGVVFVADSEVGKMAENKEALQNLAINLKEQWLNIEEIPIIFQYNKRDLKNAYSVDELNRELNYLNAPYFEASAIKGEGVFPVLKQMVGLILSEFVDSPDEIVEKASAFQEKMFGSQQAEEAKQTEEIKNQDSSQKLETEVKAPKEQITQEDFKQVIQEGLSSKGGGFVYPGGKRPGGKNSPAPIMVIPEDEEL